MEKINFDEIFPDNRHEGETILRQAQLVMLRMLKIVDYICRKHNINYWMCSGTLLGAVRHKGFIPWDDDLDISMMREDYELFVKVAIDELPDDMILQTRETDPNYHYLPLPCKVRDKKSFIQSAGYEDKKGEKGLFIDIFPFDRYHTNKIAFQWEKTLKRYNTFICKCWDSVNFADESITRKIPAKFHSVFHFLLVKYMKFTRKKIRRNQRLDKDYYIGPGFDTLWKRYHAPEEVFPLIELEFENSMFYAPQAIDKYLKAMYGPDYMTPPPEEKRNQHNLLIKPII